MKTRSIIVPKDKKAEQALDYDEALAGQLIEMVLNDEDFMVLWNEGIFVLINEISGAIIDDYEDDEVTGEANIRKVIEALNLKEPLLDRAANQLVIEVKRLFEEALNRETGVYFYF